MGYLSDHGIYQESIEKFGLKETALMVYIPIRDINGNFLFNKQRHLNWTKDADQPKFTYGQGGSGAELFNSEILTNSSYVVITEGEIDAIRLCQEGVSAVSSTSGARTFKKEWLPLFEGKKVYIVYDIDSAGKLGAEELGQQLADRGIEVYKVELPELTNGNDICDFFNAGYTKRDFNSLCKDAIKIEPIIEQISLEYDDRNLFKPVLLSELTPEDNQVEWLWEGYIAKGHLSLLSAFWKAGKSTLLGILLKTFEDSRSLAGQLTKPCRVLVLSEESNNKWYERREEFSIGLPVHIISRPIKHRLNYDQWVELIQKTTEYCVKHNIDLVVIDTISKFWSVQNENDASQVDSALLPFNYLMEKNIGVLIVHHFRKSGGDEGTAARGSGALGATVDIMIDFSRLDATDPKSTQRVLKAYSRFDETPKEVVIEFVNGEYQTLGSKSEVSKTKRIESLLSLIPENYGVTSKEISDLWDQDELGSKPSSRTLDRLLTELLSRLKIRIVGEKNVGKTKARMYAKTIAGQNFINLTNPSVLSSDPSINGGQNIERQAFPLDELLEANNARQYTSDSIDDVPEMI